MNKAKIKRIVADGLLLVGFLLMIVGILMFLILNDGIFFSTVGLGILFLLALLILPIGYVVIARKRPKPVDNRQHRTLAVLGLIVAIITFVCTLLFSLVIDFVQPLVLNTTTNILLIVASAILLLGALVELVFDNSRVSFIASIMLIVVMFVGIIWANTEGYKDFNNDIFVEGNENGKAVFVNGEGGYATFRIPSIVALDHRVINATHEGYELKSDILLATAEGRKDSSHDTGSIDMVGKISRDGGASWSELKVIYSYTSEVGKFGNPTPVLDRKYGRLIFPYMTATKANGFNYKTYVAVADFTKDGDIIFPKHEDNKDISFVDSGDTSSGSDGVRKHTLMVGPGKSIQLSATNKYSNRLVIPASSGGDSFVMYSDDHGVNWRRGASAGKGNECEVVELDNGELCMVVRDNMGCCSNHFEQYQRLSYSRDGGNTWYKQTVDTSLRSPICMSSLARLSDGAMLITYPDSFYTRANLTVGVSGDRGATFSTKYLYKGPAGYSCVTVDSNDNIYVLAEIGKVNYNEELILFKIDASKLK